MPSLAEFSDLELKGGLTQLTLDTVIQWLASKPDAVVVTDIKTDNLSGLRRIAELYPDHQRQIIPQVYEPREISVARKLGFKEIILTLYKCRLSRRELLQQIKNEDLFAVTLPASRARRWGFASNLSNGGFFTYAHTVNSVDEFRSLRTLGVCGVYSDSLQPGEISGPG